MGFFFSDEANHAKKQKAIPIHTAQALGCKICPLKNELNADMPPDGSSNPLIYCLGEAPGAEEMKQNVPFVGQSGQLLRAHFPSEWRDEIRYNNCIRTHPPGNRDPDPIELECCRKSIESDIETTKPLVVIAVGKIALNWCLGLSDLSRWRGRFVPVKIGTHACWLYPIYHPAYILRQQKESRSGRKLKSQWDYLFEQDINKVLDTLAQETLTSVPQVNPSDYLKGIQWTEGLKSDRELQRIKQWLDSLLNEASISIDYETNQLRPYNNDSKLLTISVGTFGTTFVFPYEYSEAWNERQLSELKTLFADFLVRSGCKIAHNLKFEQEWTAEKFGEHILRATSWADTMAQAYVLDERKGMLDLDTLIRIRFGFWLKSISNLDRSRMESYSLKEILPYNGLDVKWTHALFEQQAQQIAVEPRLQRVYDQLIRTSATLTLAQRVGIYVDESVRLQLKHELEQQIAEVETGINTLPEVKQFRQKMGEPYNSASHSHNKIMFTEILDYANELRTDTGGFSANESRLKELKNCELASLILELRGLTKKKSTYIDPIPDYIADDGKIHTNFNPYITATGRLSSNEPNLQNQPKRKGKEIRRMFKAPKGHVFLAGDYGQIEARLIGVASQDDYLLKALWENYDIHMEWAEKIAYAYPKVVGGKRNIKDKQIMKQFRGDIKTLWTFPAFYGASVYSLAGYTELPIEIAMDLFEEFWETFPRVRKWQNWIIKRTSELGYVETLTGRRRHIPLTPNELANSAIQGTASDICVNAMNKLSEAGLLVALNIHDDVTLVCPTKKLDETLEKHARIMAEVEYRWINVPIAVEMSVGENWCDLEDIATFHSTDYMTVHKEKFDGFDFYLEF